MAPWGALQRQMMAYLMRHPQFKAAVQNGTKKVMNSEAFKKSQQKMNSAYEQASKSFKNTNFSAKTNHTGSGSDSSSSMFDTMRRKFFNAWHAHKGRIFAFVTANLFGIIILIQFSQPLFHFFMSFFQSSSHPSVKQSKKHDKDASLQSRVALPQEGDTGSVDESDFGGSNGPEAKRGSRKSSKRAKNSPEEKREHEWSTSEQSSMYDDTKHHRGADNEAYNSDMYRDVFASKNGEHVGFETSFLVKMGDETHFTSSLERERLTGAVSNRLVLLTTFTPAPASTPAYDIDSMNALVNPLHTVLNHVCLTGEPTVIFPSSYIQDLEVLVHELQKRNLKFAGIPIGSLTVVPSVPLSEEELFYLCFLYTQTEKEEERIQICIDLHNRQYPRFIVDAKCVPIYHPADYIRRLLQLSYRVVRASEHEHEGLLSCSPYLHVSPMKEVCYRLRNGERPVLNEGKNFYSHCGEEGENGEELAGTTADILYVDSDTESGSNDPNNTWALNPVVSESVNGLSSPGDLDDLTGMEEVDNTSHQTAEYLDDDNFELVNEDRVHYISEGNEKRLAAVFIKNAVKTDVCRRAAAVLEQAATKHNLRTKTNGGTPPDTGVVGYYDYLNNPTQHKCRETQFMRNNWPGISGGCENLLRSLDTVYANWAPRHYALQKMAIPSSYQLFGTAFSTITVNRNFRTAVHTDKGDFKSGFAVLSVINGTFTGCHLAIKKIGKAFKLGVGDVLLFDASLEHGNTQVENPEFCWNRTSVVCYLRNGLCSPVCERERRNHLNRELIEKLNSSLVLNFVVNLNRADDTLPPLFVPAPLAIKLAPVQLSALNFINDRAHKKSGCVIAMTMGLGKTLVALATCFSHLHAHPSHDVLILTPKPIISHWVAECEKWKEHGLRFAHCVASDGLNTVAFEQALCRYDQQMTGHAAKVGHVFVLNPEYIASFLNRCKSFDPHLIIVDEGHRVASRYSKRNQVLECLKCSVRVVLTGTPIQNEFSELYRLISWVNRDVCAVLPFRHFQSLASYVEKYIDGDDRERTNAVRALSYIQEWMKAFVFREVENDLPPLKDYLLVCNTSATQDKIIDEMTNGLGCYTVSAADCRPFHLSTHPLCYYAFVSGRYQQLARKSDGKHARDEAGDARRSLGEEGVRVANMCSEAVSSHDIDFFLSLSGKMAILAEVVKKIAALNEKVIIFSQYIGTQDLIYRVLAALQISAYTVRGQDSLEHRRNAMGLFQHESTLTALVLSTRVAAYGLDFTVANHVVLFDSWWNPQVDAQAIARSYRRNQTKPVTVYRLASHMEDQYIIRAQMRKIALFRCVMHEETAKVSEMTDCTATDSDSVMWQLLKGKMLEGYKAALLSVFLYEEAVKVSESATPRPDDEAVEENVPQAALLLAEEETGAVV